MKILKIQIDENKVSKKVTECRQKTKNDPLRLKYKKTNGTPSVKESIFKQKS